MILTKEQAGEVIHKLSILADEPELCDDYGITMHQARTLVNSVPYNGGEFTLPTDEKERDAVLGEMKNHLDILDGIAYEARKAKEYKQARDTTKLRNELAKLFNIEESNMNEKVSKIVENLISSNLSEDADELLDLDKVRKTIEDIGITVKSLVSNEGGWIASLRLSGGGVNVEYRGNGELYVAPFGISNRPILNLSVLGEAMRALNKIPPIMFTTFNI